MGKKKKPKDHTVVGSMSFNSKTGKGEEHSSTTYYKDVADPSHLPDPALCDETIDEWAAYKKWEIDEKARLAKEKYEQSKPVWMRIV